MLSNPNHIAILAYLGNSKKGLKLQELEQKLGVTKKPLFFYTSSLRRKKLIQITHGHDGIRRFGLVTITEKGIAAIIEYADWFNKVLAEFDLVQMEQLQGEKTDEK